MTASPPPAARPRPLIVCDVDEVVLHFVAPFEDYLERRGLQLLKRSYALSGNIVEAATGKALAAQATAGLVETFFAQECHRQPPIPGSAEALTELAGHADIHFLTNFPQAHCALRSESLQGFGMPYPLHVNTGPKGQAVARLARERTGPVYFLDDIGTHLLSVGDVLPGARLIHFINDPVFLGLAPSLDGIHLRTGDWREAKRFILADLQRPAGNN